MESKQDIAGGHCLAHWGLVCKEKRVGELGIKDVRYSNTAVLVKWWRKFYITSIMREWDLVIKSIVVREQICSQKMSRKKFATKRFDFH